MNHFSSFNPQDYCPDYKATDHRNALKSSTKPIQSNVKSLFEKKFVFEKNPIEVLKLPDAEGIYVEDGYSLTNMELLKTKLNECKSKLNDYPIETWSQHTKKRNPAGDITWKVKNEMGCEFVTQAWCKFFECLKSYNLVPPDTKKLNSLHLCEAPGAFITALNHYLKSNFEEDLKWDWCATTLNPYHEDNPIGNMIMDDRFILYTLDKWYFGADNTGNILNQQNINKLTEYCADKFDEIDLITADGSINCFDDPENQESKVSTLHYAEVITALKILKNGGNFLIKMFTFFEFSSINLLYLLYIVFQELYLFKPATSKCGNSEVYVICLNYEKQSLSNEFLDKLCINFFNSSKSLFNLNFISESFLKSLERSQSFFINFQLSVIENNILTYNNQNYNYNALNKLKSNIWIEYKKRYDLNYIEDSLRILKNCNLNKNNFNSRIQSGSYSERCRFKVLESSDKLVILKNELYEYMEKFLFNYNIVNNLIIEFTASHEIVPIPMANSDFNITVGKNISKVNGSKFVLLPILNYFLNLLNYKSQLDGQPILQGGTNSFYEIHILNSNLSIKVNKKNYYKIEHYNSFEKNLIIQILSHLIDNIDSINSLTITNLPLLTHLFVSFIYYFAGQINLFKNLKFYLNQSESQVIFYNRVGGGCNDQIANALNNLRTLFKTYENRNDDDNGFTLLSFVKISNLYKKTFYNSIENYNRFLCLHLCEEYLREN